MGLAAEQKSPGPTRRKSTAHALRKTRPLQIHCILPRNWGPVCDPHIRVQDELPIDFSAQSLWIPCDLFKRQLDVFFVSVFYIFLMTVTIAVLNGTNFKAVHEYLTRFTIFVAESSTIYKQNIKCDFFFVPMNFLNAFQSCKCELVAEESCLSLLLASLKPSHWFCFLGKQFLVFSKLIIHLPFSFIETLYIL